MQAIKSECFPLRRSGWRECTVSYGLMSYLFHICWKLLLLPVSSLLIRTLGQLAMFLLLGSISVNQGRVTGFMCGVDSLPRQIAGTVVWEDAYLSENWLWLHWHTIARLNKDVKLGEQINGIRLSDKLCMQESEVITEIWHHESWGLHPPTKLLLIAKNTHGRWYLQCVALMHFQVGIWI